VTVLVDSSKFGRIASFEVCSLDRVTTLVCDQSPPEEIHAALIKAGVTLVIAGQ